jgi:hypothetical protein
MRLRAERSGWRFVVEDLRGRPVIQLELLHDTVSHLSSLTVGFGVLGGAHQTRRKRPPMR